MLPPAWRSASIGLPKQFHFLPQSPPCRRSLPCRLQIQARRILCCSGIDGLAGSVQSRHLIAQRFPQGSAADLYKFICFVQFISIYGLNQQVAFGLPAFFVDRANDKNIAEPRGAEQDHTAECQHAGFPAQTMYPAPEGRQVKVQPQQDALYGKRGKIGLPRLRKHIILHTLCRAPPRNDRQQYRGKAQQCQNHPLRVCGFGLASLRRFLQAIPNVDFCFLCSGCLPGCSYQQRNSLNHCHQHPHTAQAVHKDSRVALKRPQKHKQPLPCRKARERLLRRVVPYCETAHLWFSSRS